MGTCCQSSIKISDNPELADDQNTSELLQTKSQNTSIEIFDINDDYSINLPSSFKPTLLLNEDCNFAKIILKEHSTCKAILKTFNLSGWLPMFKDMTVSLDFMVNKYQHFMLTLKDNDYKLSNKIEPEILFIWRIHLLHPMQYIKDCKHHFGFLVCPSFECISTFHGGHGEYIYCDYNDGGKVFTTMDLEQSAKKQLNFMFELHKSYRFISETIRPNGIRIYYIAKYKAFLKTAGYLYPKCIIPTKMIDFMWHIHMIWNTANYYYECNRIAGHFLGHNDTKNEIEEEYDSVSIKDYDPIFDPLNKNKNLCWNWNLYVEVLRREIPLLINGYIKCFINEMDGNIPKELMDLCALFYFEEPEDNYPDASGPAYCSTTDTSDVRLLHVIE